MEMLTMHGFSSGRRAQQGQTAIGRRFSRWDVVPLRGSFPRHSWNILHDDVTVDRNGKDTMRHLFAILFCHLVLSTIRKSR